MVFWHNIKTKPIPNSTAEKTKKKNVKANKFKLSYIIPIIKVIANKVIQSNSAVNSKCKKVLVLIKILANNIINKIILRLNSPSNIKKIYKQV